MNTPFVDYLRPIIADADTGHGGLTAVAKLAKMFVEYGTSFLVLPWLCDDACLCHDPSILRACLLVCGLTAVMKLAKMFVECGTSFSLPVMPRRLRFRTEFLPCPG